MIKVNQQLICIDATGYLVDGEVYTVKEVFNYGSAVTVNECVNKDNFGAYSLERFFFKEEDEELDEIETATIDLSIDEFETLADSLAALRYFSEETYINLKQLSTLIDKIELNFNTNNKNQ